MQRLNITGGESLHWGELKMIEPISNLANIVKDIAASIDELTVSTLVMTGMKDKLPLKLIGGSTIFLNAIRRRAYKLGIALVEPVTEDEMAPFVIDLEVQKPDPDFSLADFPEDDIDACLNTDVWDLSCDAEACYNIIAALTHATPCKVGIIGRGHAVRGLPEALSREHYSVVQCHSKTPDVRTNVENCDIIVNASPVWTSFDTQNRIVLDVAYSVPEDCRNERVIHNVGLLTTSCVLYRAAIYYLL